MKRLVCLISALILVGSLAKGADAVPMAGFTGHTDISGGGVTDGTINFAVLTPGDPLFGLLSGAFVPGTDSGTLVAGQFIYLYQLVNDGDLAPNAVLTSHSNSLGRPGNASPGSPSSWGAFGGLAFFDGGVAIGPGLGPLPTCSDVAGGCAGDGAGGDLDGAALFGIAPAATTGLSGPVTIAGGPGPGLGSIVASYLGIPGGGLTVGSLGTMIGFTSPYAPEVWSGGILDGGTVASGATPAPAPEPATLLLLGSGLMGMGWFGRKKMKGNADEEA